MSTRDIETSIPLPQLVKEKSVTMEYFLETSHLDVATIEMLKKYDKDGNGSFSKDEVVAIILDLREAMQSNEILGASNKMFKRMFIGAMVFCFLLLTSMFGLSYAVAALTAKLDVRSDGLMLTKDGQAVIATDSTATTFRTTSTAEGIDCLTVEEMDDIWGRALSGRNAIVETQNQTHTVAHKIDAGAVDLDMEAGRACFGSGEAKICFTSSEACATGGRRLEDPDACFDHTQDFVNLILAGGLNDPLTLDESALSACLLVNGCIAIEGTASGDFSGWADNDMCKCGCYTSSGNGWQAGS